MSHPTMGAWIEIEQMKGMRQGLFGRTPRWVRGLKYYKRVENDFRIIVAPHDGCVD